MITLHRRSGHIVIVNADLIETVERSSEGETIVTLTTGNVLAIAEAPEEVVGLTVGYRRSIFAAGSPDGG